MRIKEEIVQRRLKGYFNFPRAFAYLLIDKKISTNDFSFYFQLVSLARFDKRNPMYGVVDFTNNELAIELNLSGKTVRNHIKNLINLDLIWRKEKYLFICRYEDLFTHPQSFFTKGNQRMLIGTFITDKKNILIGKRKDASLNNNVIGRQDNLNKEHIYDSTLSSYKSDISSISSHQKGGDENVEPDSIPF